MVEMSEGFSGRELQKMVVAWHDAAFTLPTAVLTPEVMRQIMEKFKLQHKLKKTWHGLDLSKSQMSLIEKLNYYQTAATSNIELNTVSDGGEPDDIKEKTAEIHK